MRDVTLADVAVPGGLVGGPFGSSLVGADYVSEGVPVIRGTNMGERAVEGPYVYVTPRKAQVLVRNAASPGDIVFTQRGTLGQVAVVGDSYPLYLISQSQMRLRVDSERFDTRFVFYACKAQPFLQQVTDSAIATGVPHINLGILARLRIPNPPRKTQTAIAEVLGALDDKIAANRLAAHKASGLAAALMAAVSARVQLSVLVDLERRTIPPASIGPQALHYSLPAFDGDELPRLEDTDSILSAKFLLERPCVLISKLNPRFPRVWAVDNRSGLPALASTEFQPLVPRSITPGVLWSVLIQPSFTEALASQVAGTSGSHQRVSPGDILATEVTDPRGAEPHALVRVDGLVVLAGQLRQETRTLSRVRDTLLPLLMSGQVRVRDAERDVERVL